jgi:hypothetical protein
MTNWIYEASDTLSGQTKVDTAVSNLMGLSGNYRQYNQPLLSYFEEEIKNIAKNILDVSEDEEDCALLIARNWHRQATECDGTLHCQRYIEACPPIVSAFDQLCLDMPRVDDLLNYGMAICGEEHFQEGICQDNIRAAEAGREEQMWILLWCEILRNCPGPVLFNPLASSSFSSFDFHLDEIPRYLFRTFDPKSSGKNNGDVVASPASENRTINSKIDILSLDDDFATTIVDWHLNPWKCRDDRSQNLDNFMSWTFSLLYAIQYALYRRHLYGCTSEDIKICVIDTEKFSRGQFVHAKRLLQAYYQFLRQADMRHSYDTRLLLYIYGNGEYLSQGVLNHKGRSCVTSLARLEENGLSSLYPELADPMGHRKWAIRTIHLRHLWEDQHVTTYEEIQMALSLAKSCFRNINELDIATMILTFKHRELRRAASGKFSTSCTLYSADKLL